MKYFLLLSLFILGINSVLFSQTISDLDSYKVSAQSMPAKNNLLKNQTQAATADVTAQESQTIEGLISTIQTVIYEDGEQTNVAKARGVRCLKADVDIPTFLQLTRADSDKKRMIADCGEVQLIRFSFRDANDFDQAKLIDFSVLNQLPQLKYVVFYVAPSVSQQKAQVQAKLESILNNQISSNSIKVFFRIPQGG